MRPEWSSIPYGKPLANQTMHVFNDWFEPSPVGVTGEIHIGGTGVAQGYLGDPERTAERFPVHPVTGERVYRTGDLGRYLPGGDIEILGREDFQVKISGYRVELRGDRGRPAAAAGVRTALVTAPAHARTGQRQIAAYVVPEPGADPIRRRCGGAGVAAARLHGAQPLPGAGGAAPHANGKVDHRRCPRRGTTRRRAATPAARAQRPGGAALRAVVAAARARRLRRGGGLLRHRRRLAARRRAARPAAGGVRHRRRRGAGDGGGAVHERVDRLLRRARGVRRGAAA